MFRKLYLSNRLFFTLAGIAVIYILAFFFVSLLEVGHTLLALAILVLLLDYFLLFLPNRKLIAQRILPEKLSNGDDNLVKIELQSLYKFPVTLKVIDELPFQFQNRDFLLQAKLKPYRKVVLQYRLTPKTRGEYHFGGLNVFVESPLRFLSKREVFQQGTKLPVYPSFVHLKKYELMALQNELLLGGIKKIRKLGHTMEFEQIKDYVQGDDIRTINWKATSKQNKLMVNQFQDEKSQRIFILIDKGRTMQMPFGGLSLLDYSINATMALSHIILKKNDRVGLMAFSRKPENKVPAEGKTTHLKKISETLYRLETDFAESDYGRLYQETKWLITQRSLILLFANFETLDALNRQMKYLRGIAKNHLLVVVFFKNSEIQNIIHTKPQHLQAVYDSIIAEKFEMEKKLIIQELHKYGILSIYTAPEQLSTEVINKYLQIKSRGIL